MGDFIDYNTVEFKKSSGKEKLRCPNCDATRTNKRDRSLIYNHNEGYGKCFYCEALLFSPDNKKNDTLKVYKLPKQELKKEYSDNFLKYWSGRGISEQTLRDLYVTEELHYQPALGKEVNNVVFNYYEEDKLVNKKYRSANKKFTQTAEAKSIFYNINTCLGSKEIIIVEGEADVLALHEIGIKNAISVPNGANNNDDYWINSESHFKDIETFIIATDNDDKGKDLKENIAQRLGRFRCKYVDFAFKDANDELLNGNLSKCINEAKRFPISGVFTFDDIEQEVFNLYDNGLPKTIKPKHKRWKEVNNIFSTLNNQLTVITGIPTHGKSSVMDDYVLSLSNDYKLKCSWYSPEHNPLELYQTTFIEKVMGKPFWSSKRDIPRITKTEIQAYKSWSHERIYHLMPESNKTPSWSWLMEKMKEQIYTYGIQLFVIDAFNKVILPKGNKLDEINNVLTKLSAFCVANNVQVILIAHPTKMKKKEDGTFEVPTLYDVSGSSDFYNQTHNGASIYRVYEDENNAGHTLFYSMKQKFNFQGKIGDAGHLKYCDINGRFYSDGVEPIEPYIYVEDAQAKVEFNKETGEVNVDYINNFEYEKINDKDVPF